MNKILFTLLVIFNVALALETDTNYVLTDSRDDKKYRKMKIETQTWMAENLNYNAVGSICYDNRHENCGKYGRLYNWETAKKVCPSGWHLPSDEEWQLLLDFAGGSNVAGKKFRAKSGWYNCTPSGSGNSYTCEDTYGFSAMPAGFGNSSGYFNLAGNYGFWWSATEKDAGSAYYRSTNYDSNSVNKGHYAKSLLLSVRCLQD